MTGYVVCHCGRANPTDGGHVPRFWCGRCQRHYHWYDAAGSITIAEYRRHVISEKMYQKMKNAHNALADALRSAKKEDEK